MQWNATAANVATCEMFMISALITAVYGTAENEHQLVSLIILSYLAR